VLAGEELCGGGGAVEGGELLILLEGVLVVETFEESLARLSAAPILLRTRGGGAGRCDGCANDTHRMMGVVINPLIHYNGGVRWVYIVGRTPSLEIESRRTSRITSWCKSRHEVGVERCAHRSCPGPVCRK